MQELNMVEVEEVSGGIVWFVAAAMVLYSAYAE
jgi:hypothetical protein